MLKKKKEARDFRALQAWLRSLDLMQASVNSCETDIFVGPKQRQFHLVQPNTMGSQWLAVSRGLTSLIHILKEESL